MCRKEKLLKHGRENVLEKPFDLRLMFATYQRISILLRSQQYLTNSIGFYADHVVAMWLTSMNDC